MDLIEKYIEEALRYLPKDTQEKAKEEIRLKIEKMLPKNPSDKDVRSVLEKLGNPMIFADEFRGVKRYLIGPKLYYQYFYLLKIVIPIAGILSGVGGIADGISQIYTTKKREVFILSFLNNK